MGLERLEVYANCVALVLTWVAQHVEVKSGYSLAQLVEARPGHLLMVYHLEVESCNLQDG